MRGLDDKDVPWWAGRPGTALVVGGTGFLGGHAVGLLAAAGWRVTVIGRRNREEAWCMPDGVDYLAADRSAQVVLEAAADADLVLDLAMFRAEHARETATALRGRKDTVLVAFGSVAEYGAALDRGEELREDRDPEPPSDAYGRGKVACLRELSRARDEFGLDFVWVVLPQAWGEGDASGRDEVVTRCIETGTPLVLRGDGTNPMPDGYAATLVEAALHAAGRPELFGKRINACGPSELTPLAYVQAAVDFLGRGVRVVLADDRALDRASASTGCRYRPPFPGGPVRMRRRALERTGFSPAHSTEEGVRRTVRWHHERPGVANTPDPGLLETLARAGRVVDVVPGHAGADGS